MSRITKTFQALKQKGRKAFIAYISSGYPDLKTTEQLVVEFEKAHVDIIELGVPFSDPIADGPVIQEASIHALNHKVNLDDIFALVKRVRTRVTMPICLMTYYNPVFCYGHKQFVENARNAGVDGLIIPDLPPEEAQDLRSQCLKANLDLIFFLSPTSSDKRVRLVSKASRGFIYYVSLAGVTGTRQKLACDLVQQLKRIHAVTEKPVCVGFGISTHEHVIKAQQEADGVIVGSAIVNAIKQNISRPDLVSRVTAFVKELIYGTGASKTRA